MGSIEVAKKLDIVIATTTRIETNQHNKEAKDQQRHDELLLKFNQLSQQMQAAAQETAAKNAGIDPVDLVPILSRLGHNHVPESKIAQVLSDAVDDLLAQSKQLSDISNDAPAIDQAIMRARDRLAKLDVTGALDELDAAIKVEEEQEAAKRKARAQLYFEKAQILSTTYDHLGAIEARKEGLKFDEFNFVEWCVVGDGFRTIGNLNDALQAYERAQKIAETNGDERNQSVAHDRIGNIKQMQGDLPGALSAYEAALAISERLAATDPSNSQWQRDLSVSHDRIGNIKLAQGDLPGALSAYEASLTIRERLAASDPSNSEWQRDLSISHNKIGGIRQAQGDLPGALSAYEAGLVIAGRLAASDPSNSEWQRDLSVWHEKIGDIKEAQGDLPGALSAYEARHVIAERLAASDPSNSEWQRDLSVSHYKIGDIKRAQGDLPGALSTYEAGACHCRASRRFRPEQQPNGSVICPFRTNNIGDVRQAQEDLPGALSAHEAAHLAITERLAASDPSNTQWQRDLIVSHCEAGNGQAR